MEKNNKLRRGLAVVAAGTGILALSGCGDSAQITPGVAGEVVGREYDDRDVIVVGRVVTVQPEEFFLRVKQCGHEEFTTPENELGCAIFTVEVSEETYQEFQDGESIVFND
jgi:hypothetical protein